MAGKTKIEWATDTWNPIRGCSRVSQGCKFCYAETFAARFSDPGQAYAGLATRNPPRWTNAVRSVPAQLLTPARWQRPRRIFVNSMSDLFHEKLALADIADVFAVMAVANWHTYIVLTKRAARMRELVAGDELRREVYRAFAEADGAAVARIGNHEKRTRFDGAMPWPLPNVWLGVSVEDQSEDRRIEDLLRTPAAKRVVSAEPLLGPIDFKLIGKGLLKRNALTGGLETYDGIVVTRDWLPALDWVIAGGESGPNARPMHPDWARSLRDQCAGAGVAYFFKQWGEWLPVGQSLPGCGKVHGATAVKPGRMKLHVGGAPDRRPAHFFTECGVEFTSTADGRLTFRVGKRAAGRLLDGVTHDAYPRP